MDRFRHLALCLCCAVVALLLAGAATAQNLITAQGALSSPGLWLLTRDLQVPCNGSPMLEVMAHGVTLDLQGFTLNCTDNNAPVISAAGFGNLAVRDGVLLGTTTLIRLNTPRNGTSDYWTFRFEKLRMANFERGIVAEGTSASSIEIRDCDLASKFGEVGIELEGFAGVSIVETTVRLNRPKVPGTFTYGISVNGGDALEIRESIVHQASMGLYLTEVEGGRLVGNTLVRNLWGIFVGNGTARVSVQDNTITGIPDVSHSAIFVSYEAESNSIDSNTLLGHSNDGLTLFGDNNVHSYNRVVGQGGPGTGVYDRGNGNRDGGGNVY